MDGSVIEMKKRWLSFVLICVMIVTGIGAVFPMTAKADFNYSVYNSFCPITIYPCSDDTLPTYTTVECTKQAGSIYKTDCCTILKFYKNKDGYDVCKVRYPVKGGGTKTAYAKTSRFIHNKSYNPIKKTITAKTSVSAYAGSSAISGWNINPGTSIYILGRKDGNTQIAFPVSGGYKIAWIKHYSVKFHANGGSGAPDAQTKTQNVDMTLSNSKPTRSGYTFQGWNTSKTGSGTKYAANAVYKANGNATLYAQWTINSYKLTVGSADAAMGTATGSGTYNHGKSATINAIPAEGYHFLKWNDGNTSAARSVTVTANAAYTASFAPNSYTVEAKSDNPEMGRVEIGGIGEDGKCSYGASVTIEAIPNPGYRFAHWNDGSDLVSRSVTVVGDAAYTATFVPEEYIVSVNSADQTMGTVSGGGTYPYLKQITITANPQSGYKFVQWSDGNTAQKRDIEVKGAAAYTAEFAVDANACTHAYGDWITDRPATCIAQGARHRVCSKCGIEEVEVLGFAEHQLNGVWEVENSATCEMEGLCYQICTVCKTYKETKPIEKKDHDFSDRKTVKAATCEEDGIAELFCKNCGKRKEQGEERIPAAGHSFPEQWTVESPSSCTKEGIQSRTCSVCGYKETDTIEETEHDFKESRHEPSETQAGRIVRICKNCNFTETEIFYNETYAGTVELVYDSYVSAGDTIRVPVKITDNPGILGCTFTIRYDPNVVTPQIVSQTETSRLYVTAGEVLKSGRFSTEIKADDTGGPGEVLTVAWSNASVMEGDGALFYIDFQVNGSAGAVISDLLLSCEHMVGEHNVSVIPSVKNCQIAIAKIKKGDINMDSEVNVFDGVVLAKYLVNRKHVQLSEAQMEAADVFADGRINIKDSVRLAQIIVGQDFSQEEVQAVAARAAAAEETTGQAVISVGSCAALPGEYVDVPVTIKNNAGIAGFRLKLDYDSEYLTPVSIEAGEVLEEGIVSNLPDEEPGEQAADALSFQWNESDNILADGVLCTVRFQVGEAREEGQTVPLYLSCEENDPVCCVEGNEIQDADVTMIAGSISIGNEVIPPSDPYEITNVSLSSGETAVKLPAKDGFDATVEFQKLTEELIPADVVLAAYDAEGRLVAAKSRTLSVQMLRDGMCTLHLEQTERMISSIKIFMWDTAGGMKPITKYYRIE